MKISSIFVAFLENMNFKKINKDWNIKEKKKSHEPFQSYLLAGQADSGKKAG